MRLDISKLNISVAILALVLILSAVPLSRAMADTHAWVWARAELSETYLLVDQEDNTSGMTSDMMSGYYGYCGWANGYADMLGTVGLSVLPSAWWLDAWAEIHDTYTFTDVSTPSASGLITGLYGRVDYSGTLTSGVSQGVSGQPSFRFSINEGILGSLTANLSWNGINYTLSVTGKDPVYVDNPAQYVSGSLVFPINGAYYGQPFDIRWWFHVYANNPASANIGVSSDFYNTMNFYFSSDGFPLGVTSIGGYSQGFNVIPLPGAVWLLGSGLIGLVGLKRRKGK